jgi:catechol 2,3-dioxygenase-like lactoylglutathione lyase family enzyme
MEKSDSVFIGVNHIGLTVADIDASTRFYAVAAGLAAAAGPEPRVPMPASLDGEGKFLRGLNARLRIVKSTSAPNVTPRPVSEAGITHVCLQSTQMESLYRQFQAAGATFHAPPVDLGTGFLYSYARDVEANVVELEGTAPVWDDPTPWIAHVSFTSADVDRLSAFYATLLGQTAIRSPRIGPYSKLDLVSGLAGTEFMAAWIPAGNMQIEVIQYLQPPTLARSHPHSPNEVGYSYICFEVADVAVAAARARDAGATQSPELALQSGFTHHFCADPDGNLLLLMSCDSAHDYFSINALRDPHIASRLLALRTATIQKALQS